MVIIHSPVSEGTDFFPASTECRRRILQASFMRLYDRNFWRTGTALRLTIRLGVCVNRGICPEKMVGDKGLEPLTSSM